MIRRKAGLFIGLVLLAGACLGQTPAHYLEIQLPSGVAPETFFARYILAGQDLGGWVQPRSGVSAYLIDTTVNGRPATGIKAILYASGCAIQTLDLALSSSANSRYSFVCQPLASVPIAGEVLHPDWLSARDIRLEVRYVARWAQPFLTPGENIVTSIPVGDFEHLTADGHFRLVVPDLSRNPLGELQIWAKDRSSGAIVAQLIPTGSPLARTRMGGLKLQNAYPEIVFAPCAVNDHQVHDEFGFDVRPQPDERAACGH
jgi:hypothetical protein